MTLLYRKRIIKVTAETNKGIKVAGTNTAVTYDMNIQPTAPFESRKGGGLYLGNSATGILGERSGTLNFSVYFVPNGASLNAFIAECLKGCGFKLNTSTWQPSSALADHKTLSFDVWEDGKKKGLAGASGTFTIEFLSGQAVKINFEFSGRWIAPTDETMPAFSPDTSSPLRFDGGTFTIDTAAKRISQASLAANCNVVMVADGNSDGGIAYYQVTDIDPTLAFDVEDELVATADYYGSWLAGTEAAIVLGAKNGNDTVTVTCPKAQYKEIAEGDREGMIIADITAQLNNDSGDDSVQILPASTAI